MEIRLVYSNQTKEVLMITIAEDTITHAPSQDQGVMSSEPNDILAFALLIGIAIEPITDFFNNNNITYNYPAEIVLP
jgi:hypothetical protein